MNDSVLLNGWCQHGIPAGSCDRCASKPEELSTTAPNSAIDAIALVRKLALSSSRSDAQKMRFCDFLREIEQRNQ